MIGNKAEKTMEAGCFGAAGNWNDPLNWSPSTGAPNAGDTATLDLASTLAITSDIALTDRRASTPSVARPSNPRYTIRAVAHDGAFVLNVVPKGMLIVVK